MRAILFAGVLASALSAALTGCAGTFRSVSQDIGLDVRNLTVDQASNARKVLTGVPMTSAMERFEFLNAQGRLISYIAFTDTKIGALVFVDQRLYGTLSHRDAQAFYSCRGYITAMNRHWAREADAWGNSLLAQAQPTVSVLLEFSGQSTTKSLGEVVKYNPFVDQLRILASVGSNPLSLFRTLDRLHDNVQARTRYETTSTGLSAISPGMSESAVADVLMPDEVSFLEGGVVMAYPSHLVEFYVSRGQVQVIQQPSFNYLSRTQLTLFYVANAHWHLCTPTSWHAAFPKLNPELWVSQQPDQHDGVRANKPNVTSGFWSPLAPKADSTTRPGRYLGIAAQD
jgi:hypothetical protein